MRTATKPLIHEYMDALALAQESAVALPLLCTCAPPVPQVTLNGNTPTTNDCSHLRPPHRGGGEGNQTSSCDRDQLSAAVMVRLVKLLEEMAAKAADKEEDEKECVIDPFMVNDWKFAALVLDRACFWFFSLFQIVSSSVVFIFAIISSHTAEQGILK